MMFCGGETAPNGKAIGAARWWSHPVVNSLIEFEAERFVSTKFSLFGEG
jgi:hypothetical protein